MVIGKGEGMKQGTNVDLLTPKLGLIWGRKGVFQ